MSSLLLRVTHAETNVVDTLGPGARAVVWVQGCSLRCPGCMVSRNMECRNRRFALFAREPCCTVASPNARHGRNHRKRGRANRAAVRRCGTAPSISRCGKKHVRLQPATVWKNSSKETTLRLTCCFHGRTFWLTDVLIWVKPGGFYGVGAATSACCSYPSAFRLQRRSNKAGTNRIEVRLSGDGGLILLGIPRPGTLAHLRKRLNEGGLQFINEQPWK